MKLKLALLSLLLIAATPFHAGDTVRYIDGFDHDTSLIWKVISQGPDNYGRMCVARKPWSDDSSVLPGFAYEVVPIEPFELANGVLGDSNGVVIVLQNQKTDAFRSVAISYGIKQVPTQVELQKFYKSELIVHYSTFWFIRHPSQIR